MQSVAVLVAALFVACAFAQNTSVVLCYAHQCVGQGQPCRYTDTTKYITYDCNSNYGCSAPSQGTCLPFAGLSQACGNGLVAGCANNGYDVGCVNNTCYYENALAPGESCSNVTTSNYPNGNPCAAYGGNCGNNCGTVNSNGNCDGNTNFCPGSQWCNFTAGGKCQNRIADGQTCTSTESCQWTSRCTNLGNGYVCNPYFGQQSGQNCQDDFDCAENTFCGLNNGASQYTCVSYPSISQSCNITNGNPCPSGYGCVCDGGAGSTNGKCVASSGNPSSFVNDVKDFLSCMSQHCNADLAESVDLHTLVVVSYTPDSCPAKNCGGNIKSAFRALDGVCTGSALEMMVALLIALVAFIFLNF